MHPSVMTWVTEQVDLLELNSAHPVLEVGSYNVNGSVRPLFDRADPYIGVDIQPGPGVDQLVAHGRLPFPTDAFDVVVSTEMLEHDTRPWRTVTEIARVLRPGGRLLLTARGFDHRGAFPLHDYPYDNWRFSVGAASEILADAGLDGTVIADPEEPGFFACAVKP